MNNRVVECKWLTSRRVVINPDGQVLPCCFFANAIYLNKNLNIPIKDYMLNSYIEKSQDLNIFTTPIEEILQHPWFDELYQSFSDSDKLSIKCSRHCTINKQPS